MMQERFSKVVEDLSLTPKQVAHFNRISQWEKDSAKSTYVLGTPIAVDIELPKLSIEIIKDHLDVKSDLAATASEALTENLKLRADVGNLNCELAFREKRCAELAEKLERVWDLAFRCHRFVDAEMQDEIINVLRVNKP